jgi:DinB superfamily
MKLISLLIGLSFFFFSPNQNTLNDSERKYALGLFEESRQKLLDEIKGLTPEQLTFRAAPDKWSIAEVVEHISISETTLAGIVEKSLKEPTDSSKRKEIKVSDQQIRLFVTNRTGKAQAPEAIKPTGRFSDIKVATAYFNNARNKNIDFLKTTQEDLRNRVWKHPILGIIDLYQSYLLISAHCERHTAQIVEVKQSANFPK